MELSRSVIARLSFTLSSSVNTVPLVRKARFLRIDLWLEEVLSIYEYSSSIYILNIISSLSFTYSHTGYIPISDHLHIG